MHKGLLPEGVMEHPNDAGRSFIADYIKDVHYIRFGLHVGGHGTHIEEVAVADSIINLVANEQIHYMLIGIELELKYINYLKVSQIIHIK